VIASSGPNVLHYHFGIAAWARASSTDRFANVEISCLQDGSLGS